MIVDPLSTVPANRGEVDYRAKWHRPMYSPPQAHEPPTSQFDNGLG